jgi:uncharacterized SAM-binding protein YcdF (DUF218 family)
MLGERLRDLFLVLMLFCLAGCALTAYTTFRVWQVGQEDGRRKVDAIIVLGAVQYDGRPQGALTARLDHAIDLYNQGYAQYLITTGGNRPGDRTTEAETGRCYAVTHGHVPAGNVLMENTGGNTLESIQNVKAIFLARGFHTALFVSDRAHMLRILMMAQDAGIEAWASPTATSPDDLDANLSTGTMLHEVEGLGLYMFVGEGSGSAGVAAPSISPATSDGSTLPVKC